MFISTVNLLLLINSVKFPHQVFDSYFKLNIHFNRYRCLLHYMHYKFNSWLINYFVFVSRDLTYFHFTSLNIKILKYILYLLLLKLQIFHVLVINIWSFLVFGFETKNNKILISIDWSFSFIPIENWEQVFSLEIFKFNDK